ncbi:sensor histidine kinase [Streptacidiphilus cavernicola]|uniref:histidine kinase n=1 Tax=Streptacidiphilus cavernicola TaxID=3342716 RepID=A0ABV6VPG8_9ACTN
MPAPTAARPALTRLLTRAPDLLLGLAVAGYGLSEANRFVVAASTPVHQVQLAVLLTAVAVTLFRTLPGTALALVWVTALFQLVDGPPALMVQLSFGVVAYGAARHGDRTVLWLSGLSLPCGAVMAVMVITRRGIDLTSPLADLVRTLGALRLASLTLVGAALLAVVTVPWLVGLLQRVRAAAERDQAEAEARRLRAETERTQAEEIAELRDGQARLARDVHDVVGHSLAVILVQAESAQFLPRDDTDAMHRTMENIAASARQSLRDVREVLASTTDDGQRTGALPPGSMDSLLDGVGTAGSPLRSTVQGRPQPLPPELEAVAFRVLQEMLTNALKHGRRGEPVLVERHWADALRLEVRNTVSDGLPEQDGPRGAAGVERSGSGIDGMRRRLDAVGGRLDVRCREEADSGTVFTATAWMPLRAGGTA